MAQKASARNHLSLQFDFPSGPTLLFVGPVKKKHTSSNGPRYEQALKDYVHGARFVMSNVGFVDDAKAAYDSCPLESVVDL